jgi:hypothetical protein
MGDIVITPASNDVNSTAGTLIIRTSDSQAISLKTNNADRLYITSAGYFGVGTTGPNYPFDLNLGTISTNTNAFGYNVSGDATSNVGYCGYNFQLNNSTANASAYIRLARTSATAYLGLEIASRSRDGIRFLTNSTTPVEVVRIDNLGDVGIGTNNPGSLINSNAIYFRPNPSAKFLDLYSDTNEADINLISNNSGDGSGIGGIYFTRARGQTDAHLQIAAIKAIQGGTNGTIAGGKLYFYTKVDGAGTPETSPAMAIDTAGNIGIGTTAPASKVQISGVGQTIMRLDSDTLNNVAQFQIKAATQGVLVAGMYGPNPVAGTVFGANTSGAAYLGTSTLGTVHPTLLAIGNTTTIPIIFGTNNTERMRLDSVGGVSIGTSSQLNSSRVSIADSALKTSAGNCLTFATATAGSNDFQLIISRGSNTDGYYAFQSVEQGVGYKNIVFNQNGGNVGIGTTNPLALLSVGNGSLADTNVPVQISSSGPGTERWFGANRNGAYGLILGYYEGSYLAGSGAYVRQITSDPLHFAVNNTTVAMSILSNTNIGIGTTNPSQKLDVNGAIIAGINNSYGAYTRTPGGVLKPWFATASANTFFYNTNVSGSIFWQNAADSATLMILTDQARLGINTNDPSGRLHVLDTVLYPPSLIWNAAAATIIRSENGQIAFGSDDTAPYGIWQQVRTSSSTARPLLLNPLGGNVGVGVRNPTKKLQVAGSLYWDLNGTSAEEHIVGIQRTVAAANGAFTEIGTLAASSNSIRATFEIFHHDSGTIEYSLFELIANYYTGATTDWVQLPSRTQAHYAGVANGVVVDARLTSTGGSIALRLRSIGGASGAMTVNVRIKSNTNLTETSATGTGATVAGLLGFNGYEFPVTNDRFKATVDGLFIKNNGNIGIGTTNPATLLHVDAAGADARIRVSAGANTVQGGMIANTGTLLVYAGSVTNHGFSLRTNDADRVRIDTNGNVGIGVTSPRVLLDLAKANNVAQVLLLGEVGANIRVGFGLDPANAVMRIFSLNHITDGGIEFGGISSDGSTWTRNHRLGLAGGNSFFNEQGGNVGIGKTNPAVKLDVAGTIRSSTNEIYGFGASDNVSLRAASSVNVLGIYTNNVERLRVDANGYLGIGLAPSTLLSVGGPGSTSAASGLTFGGDAQANLYRAAEDIIKTDGSLNVAGLIYNGNNAYYSSVSKSTTANWGQYTVVLGNASYSSQLVQVSVNGGNLVWAGTFLASCHLSYRPNETWINVKLLECATYNCGNDDVTLLALSNSTTSQYGIPALVLKTNGAINGGYGTGYANNIAVTVNGPSPNEFVLSSSSWTQPYTYQIATSANTKQIYITESGNVGIGINSPSSQANYKFLQVNGTNSAVIETMVGGARIGGFDSTASALYVGTIGNFPVIFRTQVDEKMRIDAGGNIGMGITNPAVKLDIAGGLRVTGVGQIGPAGGYGFGLFNNGTNTFAGQLYGRANGIQFTDNIGGNTVYIASGGNVGIGTTSPNAKLESYFSSNALTFNYLATNLNNTSPIPVYSFDVTNGVGETRSIKAGIGYERHLPNGRGTLHFYNRATDDTSNMGGTRSSAGDIKVSIANDGNVGISSTVPGARLDVVGAARISANILSHKTASYTTSYPGINSFGADATDSNITYYDTGKNVLNTNFRGIVWTGKHYIFTDYANNRAYFYDNNFTQITNAYGYFYVSLPIPSGYAAPHGAAWDGRYLWLIVYAGGNLKIVGYDLDSSTQTATIIAESAALPLNSTYDVEYADGHLYFIRAGTLYIYKWNGSSIDYVAAYAGAAGTIDAQAITYDGSYLWATQNGLFIYKIGLDGTPLATITSGFPPDTCGWAWNGSNIVSFDFSARDIYIINTTRLRIDTQNLALMGGRVGIGITNPGDRFQANLAAGENILANIVSNTVSASNKIGFRLSELGTALGEFSAVRDGTNYQVKLQTLVNQPLSFGTSGTTRMVIDGSFVGIGSTTPTALLNVRASIPAGIGTSPAGTNVLLDSNASNYITFRNSADNGTYAGLVFLDNNVGGYVAFGNAGASVGPDSMIYGAYQDHIFQNNYVNETLYNRPETMRIKQNGRVGIGTNTPTTLLSVGGLGSTTAASGITFGGDASANLYRDSTARVRTDGAFISSSYIFAGTYLQTSNGNIFPANFSTDIVLNVGNAAANNWETYPFTLKKGGYVGLGTNSPSGKLHIVSSVAGETVLRADGTNGTLFSVVDDLSDSLMSVNNSAGLPVLEVFADDRVVMGQYGSGDFVLINNKVGLGTSNPANKLTVIGGASIGSTTYNTTAPSNGLIVQGNVGIGSTNPDAKLQVNGEIRIASSSSFFTHLNYLDGGSNIISSTNGGSTSFRGSSNNLTSMVVYGDGTVSTNYNTYLAITSGNVGIGTTSSTYKLRVNGGQFGTLLKGGDLGAGSDVLRMLKSDDTIAMIVRGDGNVGINITSPTSKLHVVETTPTGSRIQLGSISTSALMNANLVNDFLILTAPFNAVPASTSNNNAKWGIKMGGGSVDAPNALEKSACIYAVSEEDIGVTGAGAGYNRKVGLALHTSPFDLPNVERLRITNIGNVGIGTSNPSYKLEVYSAAKTSEFVGLSISNFNNYDGTAASLVTSQLRFAILESSTDTYNASQRTFATCQAGNEANNSSSDGFFAISTRLAGAVAEKFRITSAGNVGVGITNPAYRLQVSGGDVSIASANILRFGTVSVLNTSSNANDIYANIRVIRNESTVSQDGMYVNYNSNGGAAAHLRFYANASTERMRIDASNGYVGVGTTVPDVKFDVYDNVNGANVSAVRNANTGSNAYTALVFRRDSNLNGLVMFTNSSNRSTDGGLGNSTIRTDNGKLLLGAGASTYHSLETNGNVGIGLTNPAAARLHIKGDGTNPVLRVETALLEAGTTTSSKTFVAWLPIMTGAAVGDKVFIPLFK